MMDSHGPLPAADDEPRSPRWLPLLGAVLFIAFGLAWILSPPMPPPPPSSPMAASASARAALAGGAPAPSLGARPAAAPPGLGNRLGVPPAGGAP